MRTGACADFAQIRGPYQDKTRPIGALSEGCTIARAFPSRQAFPSRRPQLVERASSPSSGGTHSPRGGDSRTCITPLSYAAEAWGPSAPAGRQRRGRSLRCFLAAVGAPPVQLAEGLPQEHEDLHPDAVLSSRRATARMCSPCQPNTFRTGAQRAKAAVNGEVAPDCRPTWTRASAMATRRLA